MSDPPSSPRPNRAGMMDGRRNAAHDRIKRLLSPLCRLLTQVGVTPNQVSFAAVSLAAAAAALVSQGRLPAAGIVFLLAGLLDLVDGALAQHQGVSSRLGALLDSTLDRVSEGVVLAAVAYHFAAMGEPLYVALTALALTGSVLVSYTRARAESLGATCTVGIATRFERVALIVVGLCAEVLEAAVILLLAATVFTTVQRLKTMAGHR